MRFSPGMAPRLPAVYDPGIIIIGNLAFGDCQRPSRAQERVREADDEVTRIGNRAHGLQP